MWGLGLALAFATPVRAEEGYGNLVYVTAVRFAPDEASATSVRIEGAFVTRGGAPVRGLVELRCPAGREVDCRTQWSMIAVGECFVFATESAPVAVQHATVPGVAPLPRWPVDGWAGRLGSATASCVAARAAAEPPRPVSLPGPVWRERRWYGWQTLMADAVIAGATVGGLLLNKTLEGDSAEFIALSGLGAYASVVPVLHAVHDRGSLVGSSIAWRLGLPVLGGGLFGERGGLGGVAVAMALDASLAVWDAPKSSAPVLAFSRDGFMLAIRQTF